MQTLEEQTRFHSREPADLELWKNRIQAFIDSATTEVPIALRGDPDPRHLCEFRTSLEGTRLKFFYSPEGRGHWHMTAGGNTGPGYILSCEGGLARMWYEKVHSVALLQQLINLEAAYSRIVT